MTIRRKPGCACAGDCADCRPEELQVQTMLEIGAPDDECEREADIMASRVVQATAAEAPAILKTTCGAPAIDKRYGASCSCGGSCPACRADRAASQAEEASHRGRLIQDRILQQRGGGEPLPEETRREMEAGFDSDFGGVRLHTDGEAAELSADLSARAFTVGNDIWFGRGQFDPGSRQGRKLIAHELTHTVQQRGRPRAAAQPPTDTVQRAEDEESTELPLLWALEAELYLRGYPERLSTAQWDDVYFHLADAVDWHLAEVAEVEGRTALEESMTSRLWLLRNELDEQILHLEEGDSEIAPVDPVLVAEEVYSIFEHDWDDVVPDVLVEEVSGAFLEEFLPLLEELAFVPGGVDPEDVSASSKDRLTAERDRAFDAFLATRGQAVIDDAIFTFFDQADTTPEKFKEGLADPSSPHSLGAVEAFVHEQMAEQFLAWLQADGSYGEALQREAVHGLQTEIVQLVYVAGVQGDADVAAAILEVPVLPAAELSGWSADFAADPGPAYKNKALGARIVSSILAEWVARGDIRGILAELEAEIVAGSEDPARTELGLDLLKLAALLGEYFELQAEESAAIESEIADHVTLRQDDVAAVLDARIGFAIDLIYDLADLGLLPEDLVVAAENTDEFLKGFAVGAKDLPYDELMVRLGQANLLSAVFPGIFIAGTAHGLGEEVAGLLELLNPFFYVDVFNAVDVATRAIFDPDGRVFAYEMGKVAGEQMSGSVQKAIDSGVVGFTYTLGKTVGPLLVELVLALIGAAPAVLKAVATGKDLLSLLRRSGSIATKLDELVLPLRGQPDLWDPKGRADTDLPADGPGEAGPLPPSPRGGPGRLAWDDLSTEQMAMLHRTRGKSPISREDAAAELALARAAEVGPSRGGGPEFVEEVDLGNDHAWRRTLDGMWCRFTATPTNCTAGPDSRGAPESLTGGALDDATLAELNRRLEADATGHLQDAINKLDIAYGQDGPKMAAVVKHYVSSDNNAALLSLVGRLDVPSGSLTPIAGSKKTFTTGLYEVIAVHLPDDHVARNQLLDTLHPATKNRVNNDFRKEMDRRAAARAADASNRWEDFKYDDHTQEKQPCFIAGTSVHTPGGVRPIEELSAGDLVFATDPATVVTSARRVEATHAGWTRMLVHIGAGGEAVSATAGHRFWVASRSSWREAAELRIGDLLLGRDGTTVKVESVDGEVVESTTYNLTVEGDPTYLVGQRGVLVHNGSGYDTTKRDGKTSFVYVVRDKTTDPPRVVYVGKTTQESVETRFRGHLTDKPDWSRTTHEVLEVVRGEWTPFELAVWERYYLNYYEHLVGKQNLRNDGNPLSEDAFLRYRPGGRQATLGASFSPCGQTQSTPIYP